MHLLAVARLTSGTERATCDDKSLLSSGCRNVGIDVLIHHATHHRVRGFMCCHDFDVAIHEQRVHGLAALSIP
jgi:hypothetical protein